MLHYAWTLKVEFLVKIRQGRLVFQFHSIELYSLLKLEKACFLTNRALEYLHSNNNWAHIKNKVRWRHSENSSSKKTIERVAFIWQLVEISHARGQFFHQINFLLNSIYKAWKLSKKIFVAPSSGIDSWTL